MPFDLFQRVPNLFFFKTPLHHLFKNFHIDEFMKIVLDSVFHFRLRMLDPHMTAFSKSAVNDKPKFSARFNPLRLRDVRKTVTRHTRAGGESPVHYQPSTDCHCKGGEERQNT